MSARGWIAYAACWRWMGRLAYGSFLLARRL